MSAPAAVTSRHAWTTARTVTVAGLIAGVAGIGLLKAAGVAMPVVPPGAVLLLVAAVLVATVRGHRWPAVPVVLIGLAELVPAVVGMTSLYAESGLVIAGTALRIIGAVTAVIGAAVLWRTGRAAARRTA